MAECSLCNKQGTLVVNNLPFVYDGQKLVPSKDTFVDSIFFLGKKQYCESCFHLSANERKKLKKKLNYSYEPKLKKITKEEFEDIINKSNYKSECLNKLKKYSERNKWTCLLWIKKFDLLDEYNKLPQYEYKKGVDSHRGLNQDEIDYWQNIANKSNSFKEMYDIHQTSDSNFPKRSYGVFTKYLNVPFILSKDERKEKLRQERIDKTNKLVESLSFIKEVISLDYSTNETKISYICKEGHFISPRKLRDHKGCSICYKEKRKQEAIEREQEAIEREQERKERIKLSKQKDVSDKLKRVDEFFQNNEWKNFEGVSDWPIKNDIIYLRKYNKFKYENEYNQISYFEYKSPSANPPIEPKENHKWCRYCGEEKHFDDFPQPNNKCTTCRQEYRRENYAERERAAQKDKYWSDPTYRLQSVINTHVWNALKGLNTIKDKRFEEFVGLSKEDFRNYIESLMTDKMTWHNYGTYWVIQHIVPRAWRETEEDVYKLNYYHNLMPYEWKPNASLQDNIVLEQLNHYHYNDERMQYFLDKAWKENRLYENTTNSYEQYLKDNTPITVQKIDNKYDSWRDYISSREYWVDQAKWTLSKAFTPKGIHDLKKYLEKMNT